MNTYLKLKDDDRVDKNSELVKDIKEWVDKQYDDGRVTVLTDEELLGQIRISSEKLGVKVKGID